MRLELGRHTRQFDLSSAVVAGFTGRDRAAVERHIAELARLGVPEPAAVPAFYSVSPESVVQVDAIEVVHSETSGEAEVALVHDGGELLVTLASDHTDRRLEASDVSLSKRACPKPVAASAWRLVDVVDHWDELRLRSWIEENGQRRLYQDGRAAELLAPAMLLALLPRRLRPSSFALLCGTVPVIGEIRAAARFAAQLCDPVLDRCIQLRYDVTMADPPGAR